MTDRRTRFEALYGEKIDPWDFRTSPYEKAKYAATLAMLPKLSYGTTVEAGCSIGELSRVLAARCTRFYGIDISEIAIAEAKRRNRDYPNMQFFQAELPKGWPTFPIDLVVLSEFLYFLSPAEIEELSGKITNTWAPNGDCIVVSFLGATSEMLQGAQSAQLMIKHLQGQNHTKCITEVNDGYRIDLVRKFST